MADKKKLLFFFGALDGTLFPCTVTEIVPGRQHACADQMPNQEEYTVRSPPRGACPLTQYARAPSTISTSDAITHTEHRKAIHVYDTYGYTCLASAFTGRVGAWHSRLSGRGVDQCATRSPDMRRDMALGRGSVFAVFLVRIVGEIRRTAGGEHARRGAAGCTPITPFTHRGVDGEEE
jgi:hypothetical protein